MFFLSNPFKQGILISVLSRQFSDELQETSALESLTLTSLCTSGELRGVLELIFFRLLLVCRVVTGGDSYTEACTALPP